MFIKQFIFCFEIFFFSFLFCRLNIPVICLAAIWRKTRTNMECHIAKLQNSKRWKENALIVAANMSVIKLRMYKKCKPAGILCFCFFCIKFVLFAREAFCIQKSRKAETQCNCHCLQYWWGVLIVQKITTIKLLPEFLCFLFFFFPLKQQILKKK